MKVSFLVLAIVLGVFISACSTPTAPNNLSLADAYRLDVKKIDLATGTDFDGVLYGYYAGDSLKVLTIRIGLSNYVSVDTFIYEGSSLVNFRRESFNNPEMPVAMREPFSRADYVVKNGNVILVTSKGLEQPAPTMASLNDESDFFRKCADSKERVVNVEKWIKGDKASIQLDSDQQRLLARLKQDQEPVKITEEDYKNMSGGNPYRVGVTSKSK
jgi:hypothetical protein